MASKETFDFIFNLALEFAQKTSIPDCLTESIKKSRVRIEVSYNNNNKDTKGKFMRKNVVQILDRHKCAACFIIAFMEGLEIEENCFSSLSLRIKEKLAIYIGLQIMKLFIINVDNPKLSAINKKADAKLIKHLKSNNNFSIPQKICDNKEYLINWTSELHYALEERKLFALSISHQLFLLETYSVAVVN
jgi:hypothetical protein